MPAQKHEDERNNHSVSEEDVEQEESDDDGSTSSSGSEDKEDFILVKLAEIRKEVQCPICLGIIRKTRTVMECLHRFCRECIDKSMRMGNNECPACRAHCASRRSLRDDPNYDALIAVLYPDIDKFEAEEFAFEEEEKARNKQIQASIAQTSRRQLEALGKKRTTVKATTAVVFTRRSQANTRNLRGRRRKSFEPQGSENEEEEDEDEDEVRGGRQKRWRLASSSGDDVETPTPTPTPNRDVTVGTSEILTWGRGGIRSHTRHGSNMSSRNTRVSRLMDHIRKLPQNNNHKLDIHLKLISLDEQNIPNPQHVYLCCSPTMPVMHIIQHVSVEKGLQDDEIEVLMVKLKGDVINPLTDELQLLEQHQTLLDVAKTCAQEHLTLVYRKKKL